MNFSAPFDKQKSTERYAQNLANEKGERVYMFKVPNGTGAYQCGMRFGTYTESERAEYERDGAVAIKHFDAKVST